MFETSCEADHRIAHPSPAEKRLFYGWVMLPIAMLGFISTAPAQTFGVAPFNDAFRQSMNLTHSQLSAAYMFGTLLACLPMGFIGSAADRFGIRRVKTIVILGLVFACLWISQAQGLYSLFIGFLLLRMMGQGALGMLSSNTLAHWFERKLGFVEGLRHFGMACAIGILPPVILWMIQTLGWRAAYATLGLVVAGIMLPLMLIWYRERPEQMGQYKDGLPPQAMDGSATFTQSDPPKGPVVSFTLRQAAATRAFWIVAGAWAMWGMISTAIFFHIVPILGGRGMQPTQAAMLFTTFAITLAITHLLAGWLADRIAPNKLLTLAMLFITASLVGACAMHSAVTVQVTAICMGLAQGTISAVLSPIWARYYGREHLGAIRGVLASISVGSTSIGPFLLGMAHDVWGSFDLMLWAFSLMPLPFILLAMLATPPAPPLHAASPLSRL